MDKSWVEGLKRAVHEIVEGLGYECVLVAFKTEDSRQKVQVFIDTLGGVDVGDCETVSKAVNRFLDEEDLPELPKHYYLEVSSPGVERPLVTPENYRRFRGREANVRMLSPLEGRKTYTGTIGESDENAVTLLTEEGERVIPFEKVKEAFLVFRGLEPQKPQNKAPRKRSQEKKRAVQPRETDCEEER